MNDINFINFLKKIVLVLIGLFYFCNNPFATREPEPPTQERSNWLQPISPDIVMDNLEYSIIEANVTNYMKCLTDSNSRFRFNPDPFVKVNNQGFFDNWNLSDEHDYISKLFAATRDSVRKATFTDMNIIDYQDSVLVKLDYKLELHHNSSENYPKYVKGQVEFWLNNSKGEWYITRWDDYGIGEESSWSSIKAIWGK